MDLRKRKRIAVIGVKGLPGFGGSARAMESLVAYLKDQYEFIVYAIDSHTSVRGWANGYRQIVFRGNQNPLLNTFYYYWKSLLHCIFVVNVDLVHINHGPSGFIVPFLKMKYPVVMTLRGVYDEERYDEKFSRALNRSFKIFQLVAFKWADILVSVSRHEVGFVKRHTRKDVLHIPNGVTVEDMDSEMDVPYEGYILFAAARIYAIKGCDIFLRALKEIGHEGEVLIIGDMEQDQNHKELLRELAKGLDVAFIDLIREKSLLMAYLKKAKIFVFPSRMEGMSNMLLEVAAIGCPVICSDIRANTGVFTEEEVIFFKSGDFQDLGQKILFALKNSDIVQQRAMLAKKKVTAEYSWEYVAQQYRVIYEELIRQGTTDKNMMSI